MVERQSGGNLRTVMKLLDQLALLDAEQNKITDQNRKSITYPFSLLPLEYELKPRPKCNFCPKLPRKLRRS